MSVKLELPVGIDEDLCECYCHCYDRSLNKCLLRENTGDDTYSEYTNFCAMNSILQVSQDITEVRNGGEY